MAAGLEYTLLGPVGVTRDGVPIPVPGAKQRTLLAALLLEANRVASSERLIGRLWEDAAPANARGALHSQVKRLRQLLVTDLEPESGPITTHPDGYLLTMPEKALDLNRFLALRREARGMAEAGRLEGAIAAYDEALALWSGEPLDNVGSQSLRRDFGDALSEHRLALMEARIDAQLQLGRHHEVLTELAELTAAHPLRERFWQQRLLALYRSDRQAEALAMYQEIAGLLVEELGVDPGPGLQELHQAILTGRPEVGWSAPAASASASTSASASASVATADAAPSAGAGSVARPRQLPPPVSGFTGRGAQLKALDELAAAGMPGEADSAGEASGSGSGTLIVIDGPAGIGKTALAVHWAHKHRARFSDGQIYLNLYGYGPLAPVPAAIALDAMLRALGMPSDRIPGTVEERTAALRSATTDRRLLFLLDNARDAQQVRPLLPGAGCVTLVTSRSQLRGLAVRDGARRVPVGGIDAYEAARLLAGAGRPALSGARDEIERLVERCAGLPLAIRIVAERLSRDERTLDSVLCDLDDVHSRLDLLSSVDDELSDMRAVLSWSVEALDSDTARALRLIGAQPGPDITVPAAAALLDLAHAQTAAVLDRLVSVHLLESLPGERYQLHDLLRAYAVELSAQHSDDEQAVHRLIDWYLAAAARASYTLYPRRSTHLVPIPAVEAPLPQFTASADAMDWFDTVRPALIACVDAAAEFGLDDRAWMLAWSMWEYLDQRDRIDEHLAVHHKGLAAARRCGSRRGEAFMLNGLTYSYVGRRDAENAMEHARALLQIVEELGEPRSMAVAYAALADVYRLLGDSESAMHQLRQALEIYTAVGDQGGELAMLANLAAHLIKLDRPDEAIANLERSYALARICGQDRSISIILRHLGDAHAKAERYPTALAYYRQALTMDRERAMAGRLAGNLFAIARVFKALGQTHLARAYLTGSRDLFQHIGRKVDDETAAEFATLDDE